MQEQTQYIAKHPSNRTTEPPYNIGRNIGVAYKH